MKVILCHREEALGAAWRDAFASVPGVEVVGGDILQVKCDAIVSPANSFGFMDGGLDHLLSERFGWDLEKKVQQAIRSRPMGELLVGEAALFPTGDALIPWLICAPTMRVPMRIRTSVNAYLAMKALLVTAAAHQGEIPIETIAVPGLGTGIGCLAPDVAARQMCQAYREVALAESRFPGSFAEAQKMHLALNRTAMIYD